MAHDDPRRPESGERARVAVGGRLRGLPVATRRGRTVAPAILPATIESARYVGDGLAATDLAHFLTASVAGDELLSADGELRDGALVDSYYASLVDGLVEAGAAADATAAAALAPRDAFQGQFDDAVVDKARYVFSYLWPRIDASPAELEAHATVANRNSYNKDVRAAAFLVKRVDAALRRRFPEVC